MHLTDTDIDKIVVLYYEKKSVGEIARICGVPAGKVYWVLTWDAFFFAKMWYNTATSHIGFFSNLAYTAFGAIGFFKIMGWERYYFVIPIAGLLEISLKLIFGRFVFRKGLATREITISQRYNKQIMTIYHDTENMKSKEFKGKK